MLRCLSVCFSVHKFKHSLLFSVLLPHMKTNDPSGFCARITKRTLQQFLSFNYVNYYG